MLDGEFVVEQFRRFHFSHVVWIPDSTLGPWESALAGSDSPKLIRACREGEVLGICAGLMLGRARPLAIMQCTGLFEAGDALRNVVHDLGLPLKMLVGVRSYQAFAAGKSKDNCPAFTEPILQAWQVPYTLLPDSAPHRFVDGLMTLAESATAHALLLGE